MNRISGYVARRVRYCARSAKLPPEGKACTTLRQFARSGPCRRAPEHPCQARSMLRPKALRTGTSSRSWRSLEHRCRRNGVRSQIGSSRSSSSIPARLCTPLRSTDELAMDEKILGRERRRRTRMRPSAPLLALWHWLFSATEQITNAAIMPVRVPMARLRCVAS